MKTLFYFQILFAVLLFQYSFAQGPYSGSGNWLELDGYDDYAYRSESDVDGYLDLGNTDGEDFTIECFFNVPNTDSDAQMGLIEKTGAYQIYMNMNPSTSDYIAFKIGGVHTIAVSTVLSIGWHHIAASYDNNTGTNWDQMYLYLDGYRVASYNSGSFYYNPGIPANDNSYNVGRWWIGPWVYFSDKIDEMRLSNILRYGETYTVPIANFTSDANTLALWHFDEVSGSTSFADATGNGNTLTGQNGASTLPVELISFSANNFGNFVQLNWQTATEVNNYGFEIQRTAALKNSLCYTWRKIGFVEGSGNSNSSKVYSFIDENVLVGKYIYRLMQIDNDGHFKYSNIVEVELIPDKFALYQNYPNPFNSSSVIKYSIPYSSQVTLKIFNTLSKEIETLVNEEKPVGTYELNWNAANLPSGVYFYRLQTGSFGQTRKMLLLK